MNGAIASAAVRSSAERVAEWLLARQIRPMAVRASAGGIHSLDTNSSQEATLLPSGLKYAGHTLSVNGWHSGKLRPGDLVVVPLTTAARSNTTVRRASGGEAKVAVANHIFAEVLDGRLDRSSRAVVAAEFRRFVLPRLPLRAATHGRLGSTGGLVWRVSRVARDEVLLDCYDAGGFLDPNPNTEADAWSPQAAGMYYADAYAAAVFAMLGRDDNSWLSAAKSAANHVLRTYNRYPTAPIWYHHDFKNAPLLEAAAIASEINVSPTILHGDSYEPTNVMAVRLHWLAQRKLVRPCAGDDRRIERCRATLLARQTNDGLFRDDRPPVHNNVDDLSYHLFALAFLGRYLSTTGADEAMQDAFRRGCELACDAQLSDGQIALSGRGTNNNYQTAAAIYALALATQIFSDDRYAGAATSAWHYLSPWQHEEGWYPVAANTEPASRMAWNHCATPYNALIAYFLLHAANLGQNKVLTKTDKKSAVRGHVARLTGHACQLGFVAGHNTGYAWSGRHRSGIAGATGLLLNSSPNLFLSPETLVDIGLHVTDLPVVEVGGAPIDWAKPGVLDLDEYELNYETAGVAVTYRCLSSELHVQITLPESVDISISAVSARLPLLGPHVADVRGTDDGFTVAGAFGVLTVSTGFEISPTMIDVPSNPRGSGVLLSWPLTKPRPSYRLRFDRRRDS